MRCSFTNARETSWQSSLKDIKRFFYKMFMFLLCFWLIDLLVPFTYLYIVFNFNLDEPYEVVPADILILGDSHTAFAIDPDLFKEHGLSAMNYSRVGHYAEFNYNFYKYYRHSYPPPDVVVYSAPHFIFRNSRSELIHKIPLTIRRNPWDMFLQLASLPTSRFFQFNQFFNNVFEYIFSGLKIQISKPGYVGVKPELSGARAVGFASKKRVPDYAKPRVRYTSINEPGQHKNFLFFQKLLKMLASDRVTVMLVETPEYIGTQDYILGKDQFYEEIEEAISGYQNVYFIKQDEIQSIDPDDKAFFNDGGYGLINSHLSYRGSRVYTREIIKMLHKIDNPVKK